MGARSPDRPDAHHRGIPGHRSRSIRPRVDPWAGVIESGSTARGSLDDHPRPQSASRYPPATRGGRGGRREQLAAVLTVAVIAGRPAALTPPLALRPPIVTATWASRRRRRGVAQRGLPSNTNPGSAGGGTGPPPPGTSSRRHAGADSPAHTSTPSAVDGGGARSTAGCRQAPERGCTRKRLSTPVGRRMRLVRS